MFKCKLKESNGIMNEVFKDREFTGPKIRDQLDFYNPKINTVSYGENSLGVFRSNDIEYRSKGAKVFIYNKSL